MLHLLGREKSGILVPNEAVFSWISIGVLGLQYFWFAMVFWLNRAAAMAFPDDMRDETNVIFCLFHWILTFPVILGYCCVELWGFMLLTTRGKSVCKHKPSKKDSLQCVTVGKF